MAWTYSDYVTYDRSSATRLTRLRLHIQEVSDALQAGDWVQSGGVTVGQRGLTGLLERLQTEEATLERLSSGGLRFSRGRPRT